MPISWSYCCSREAEFVDMVLGASGLDSRDSSYTHSASRYIYLAMMEARTRFLHSQSNGEVRLHERGTLREFYTHILAIHNGINIYSEWLRSTYFTDDFPNSALLDIVTAMHGELVQQGVREYLIDFSGDLAPTRDETGLNLRPSSHGMVDEAHNLQVKYKGCYGVFDNKTFYVGEFRLGEDRKDILLSYYAEGSTSYNRVKFDPTRFKLLPAAHGWFMFKNVNLYIERVTGGFVRGTSRDNSRITGAVSHSKTTKDTERYSIDHPLIPYLINRQLIPIDEGVAINLPHIIPHPEILLTSVGKQQETNNYYLYFGNAQIGIYITRKQIIKLNPEFAEVKPIIEGLLPYEIK